jgi:hypothetical protein
LANPEKTPTVLRHSERQAVGGCWAAGRRSRDPNATVRLQLSVPTRNPLLALRHLGHTPRRRRPRGGSGRRWGREAVGWCARARACAPLESLAPHLFLSSERILKACLRYVAMTPRSCSVTGSTPRLPGVCGRHVDERPAAVGSNGKAGGGASRVGDGGGACRVGLRSNSAPGRMPARGERTGLFQNQGSPSARAAERPVLVGRRAAVRL